MSRGTALKSPATFTAPLSQVSSSPYFRIVNAIAKITMLSGVDCDDNNRRKLLCASAAFWPIKSSRSL